MLTPSIAFLGDSLTYGYGLPREQAFPALIGRRIAEQGGPAWKIINAGINGDTTAGGLRRAEQLLAQRPNVLFLALGANDALRGVPPAVIEANLRAIIERARKLSVTVVLAGMKIPALVQLPYIHSYNAVFPKLAVEYRLPFVPFLLEGVMLDATLNLPDGVHPNAAGMKIVAAHAWKALGPVLARVSLQESPSLRAEEEIAAVRGAR